MGYGGPRVAFYTANHYANHAAAIQREDAARVHDIVRRRNSTPEAERLRQREEAFRAYEQAQAAETAAQRAEAEQALEARRIRDERQQRRLATKGRRGSLTASQSATRRTRQAHINSLSQPRQCHEAMYGSGTYGRVMHQRTCVVEFPVGRNGAEYTPGVDRDRIVPGRPDLKGTTPPWLGSYSTHHGVQEKQSKAAKEEAAYYCGQPAAPPRSTKEEEERQQTLRDIAAEHAGAAAAAQPQTKPADGASDGGVRGAQGYDNSDDDDDGASVFSHGSSNGPIVATGNMHVCTSSTKDSVRLHLSRYGGSMTAPRAANSIRAAPLESLTLPELSARIIKVQAPTASTRR